MIRVFKGNDVKVVTQGVYKSLYAPLGYKPIIEEKKVKAVVKEPDVKEPDVKEPEVNEPTLNKESSKTTKRKRGE